MIEICRDTDVAVARALGLNPYKDALDVWRIDDDDDETSRILPFYSRDAQPAYAIVKETMSKFTWQITASDRFHVAIVDKMNGYFCAYSETLPLAVCAAFLMAKGVCEVE